MRTLVLVMRLMGSLSRCCRARRRASRRSARRSADARASQPQPPAQARRQRRRAAEESRAACSTSSRRQFEFGGRWSSIDGDPARFQRYQDLRDGVLFTERAFRARRTGRRAGCSRPELTTSAGAISATSPTTSGPGRLSITGLWDQIPQFYSVDTETPYTSHPTGRSCWTMRRSARFRTGRPTLNAYVPLAPQFDLRERRDIGTRRRHGHATPQLDITASFTTTKHSRRAAVGRELRVQQRRRGGAAVRLADERLHRRRGMDEHPEHAARRLRRLVVRQSRRHARLGQPAAPRRLDERARARPDGAVAVELGADRQRRRLHQAGAAGRR